MPLPPDARTYLEAAAGTPVSAPFAWRVGWPWALRLAGVRAADAGVVVPRRLLVWWPVVVGLSAAAVLWSLGWRAGLLVLALPMARQWWRWPLMPDAAAFALACVAAVSPWYVAVPAALLAGSLHERAPVFAAAWGWSPWPLVGLVVPALAWVWARRGPARPWEAGVIESPVRTAWESVQAAPLWVYALPWGWGLAVLAPGALWSWSLAVSLALAYGQCVVAVDRARLYQWAAPAVAVACLPVLGAWWPLAVVLTLAVPWEWSAVAWSPWRIQR